MKVLICGSRDWVDRDVIRAELEKLVPETTTVVHGDCRRYEAVAGSHTKSADAIADDIAHELGFKVMRYPADWSTYGKAAGPIRNKQMMVQEDPDLVLAFHNNYRESRGTRNMIETALRHSDRVQVFLVQKTADAYVLWNMCAENAIRGMIDEVGGLKTDDIFRMSH